MLSETEVSWDKGLKIGNNERGRGGRERGREREGEIERICMQGSTI